MIKLSKTSKLGCMSWSLQAIDTCPGSIGHSGELVEACRGCYATTGKYLFANVKAPRLHNREDWKRTDWVNDMVDALKKESHFRWFDSGDVYAIELAEKILDVIKRTPQVKHWLPTRMHKFTKFLKVLDDIDALPNAVVRHSMDEVYTTGFYAFRGSATVSGIIADSTVPTNATVCRAYEREGKCGECRECWNKTTKAIAYPAHGVKMRKVINLQLQK